MSRSSLAQAIYETALSCGFDNCGIIPISALDGYKQRLQEREEAVPQSRPFYQNIEHLAAVRELYPWAKSVVVCITWLGAYRYPLSLQGLYGKAFFLSPDTAPDCEAHRQKLRFEAWMGEQGLRFEGGETNAPARIIPLRYAAVAAGLGIFRKNNFFYAEKGSYYELEGYLIDQPCEYTHECRLRPCADSCTLCQKACRTKALSAPYTMNPLSCTSFWTTFGQGAVPPHLTADQFTTWLCGCDACQDACPYNRHDWSQGKKFPGLQELEPLLQPENIVAASDTVLRRSVIPKTDLHVSPDQVQTLRTSALRVLAYLKKRGDTSARKE